MKLTVITALITFDHGFDHHPREGLELVGRRRLANCDGREGVRTLRVDNEARSNSTLWRGWRRRELLIEHGAIYDGLNVLLHLDEAVVARLCIGNLGVAR